MGEKMAGNRKVHRIEGGNVRERGGENAWMSEKGGEEEEDKAYTYERERNRNGGGGVRGENTSALDRRVESYMYIYLIT